jgi:hypothetical protein
VFFFLILLSAVVMSCLCAYRIRDSAAKEMAAIFWFHMRITAMLACVYLAAQPVTIPAKLMMAFAAFCNVFCLADRFWDVQLRTLVYWPPFCQCVFLVSRLLLMTISIIVGSIGARVGWVILHAK